MTRFRKGVYRTYTPPGTATTIKLDSSVRDRLNELAAAQGRTAGSMVEKLLDDYLWRQKVEVAVGQMSSMSAEERGDYLAEVQLWDSTAGDGLERC